MSITDLAEALGSTTDLRDESPLVRSALSALGRLLGASLAEPPRTLRSFVERYLGVPSSGTSAVSTRLPGAHAALVHVEVGRLLDGAHDAVLADDIGYNAPGYELVTVDVEEQVAAPEDLAAFLEAGTVFDFDAVLVLTQPGQYPLIVLRTRRADADAARDALSALVARALGPRNFYRGKTLQATADEYSITFEPIRPSSTVRADVIQPDAVWTEIDANIGGLTRHGDALVAAGLGASRGLLLVGPPGVGKTALCRVIAGELPPETTTIVVDSAVTPGGLARIYDALADLAPAAVFLDDIDLMSGDRRRGTAGPHLGEFLTKLDGFTPSAAVVTVATTNAADVLDPALIRAGRFDAVVEIGAPQRSARAAILGRYLAPVAPDVDVASAAARTEGASGADLREIVRRAVLEHGTALTESGLLDVVASGRWRPQGTLGQYL